MNIDEFDERDLRVAVLCFGPTELLPVDDIILAQKIALEADEESALLIANRKCVTMGTGADGMVHRTTRRQ